MGGERRGRKLAPKSNVLCLGMSYPCVERQLVKEGVSWANIENKTKSVDQTVELVRRNVLTQMDGRDLARCIAMELACNTIAYTVSQEAGAEYDPMRHLTANFNRRNFAQQIKKHWGEGIKFSQIILDYFWIPQGTWMMQHWTKSFFTTTLPSFVKEGLLEFDSGKKKSGLQVGVIYLPFCFHVIKEIISAIDVLSEFYTISFVYKSELQEHALWTGTSKICPREMQEWLGKQLDQEEIYCTFSSRDVSECIEDAHVTKNEIERILRQIEDFDDVRMIRLRPLTVHTLMNRSLRPDRARCKPKNLTGFDVGGFIDLKPPDEVVRGYDELLMPDDSTAEASDSDDSDISSVPVVSEDTDDTGASSAANCTELTDDFIETRICNRTKKPKKKRVLELLDLTLPVEPNLSLESSDSGAPERKDFANTNNDGCVTVDEYESFSNGDGKLRSPLRKFKSIDDYEDFCQQQIEARRGVNLLLDAFDRIEQSEYEKITTPVKVIGPVKQRKKPKACPRRLVASFSLEVEERTPLLGPPESKKLVEKPTFSSSAIKKRKQERYRTSGDETRKRCKASPGLEVEEEAKISPKSARHDPAPASRTKVTKVVHKEVKGFSNEDEQAKYIVPDEEKLLQCKGMAIMAVENYKKSKALEKNSARVPANIDRSPISKMRKQKNAETKEELSSRNLFSSLQKCSRKSNASRATSPRDERACKGDNHSNLKLIRSQLESCSQTPTKSSRRKIEQYSENSGNDPRACHEEKGGLKDRMKRAGYTIPMSLCANPEKAIEYIKIALPEILHEQGLPSADIDRIVGVQMKHFGGDKVCSESEASSPEIVSFDQIRKPYKVNAYLDPESYYADSLRHSNLPMQTIVNPDTTVAEFTRMLVENLAPKVWLLPICQRLTSPHDTRKSIAHNVYVSYGNRNTTRVDFTDVDNENNAHVSIGIRTSPAGPFIDPEKKVSSFLEHRKYYPCEVFLCTKGLKWQEATNPNRSLSLTVAETEP